MSYNQKTAIEMIKKSIEHKITSEQLSDWAFNAWYYYMEGKGKKTTIPKAYLSVLLDITSQWAIIKSQNKDNNSIPKDWLKEWLKKLEKMSK